MIIKTLMEVSIAVCVALSLLTFYTLIFYWLFRLFNFDLNDFLNGFDPNNSLMLGIIASGIILVVIAVLSFITYKVIYNAIHKILKLPKG